MTSERMLYFQHENLQRRLMLQFHIRMPLSLVLELAPLGDLRTFVKQNPVEPSLKLRMLEQCASALVYIHRQKVLHRDLALRNVLGFSIQPVLVKLSDFGCKLKTQRSKLASIYPYKLAVHCPCCDLALRSQCL
jgi:serine/threonine protein kinase